MSNLDLYNKVRTVPDDAKKAIGGGRLKGKTDINPMWRIKTLTEQFGPCGTGWKYVITDKCQIDGKNGEVAAFVDILLYVKTDGEWGDGIPGTGGSMFVAIEKGAPYVNDECYKMALTDAISVACKALGVGADVYWEADKSKYDRQTETAKPPAAPSTTPLLPDSIITDAQRDTLVHLCRNNEQVAVLKTIREKYGYAATSKIKIKDLANITAELRAALEDMEAPTHE